MSIQKPYALSIMNMTIDASQSYNLKWQTSGDTSSSFAINIYKNSDGTSAWSLPRTYSFATSYTIPANFVVNGQDYKVKVTVWNANSDTAYSDYVVFTASSSPVVTVDTIPTVTNHAYLFTGHYTQAESVSLKSYTVNLYNSNQILINTSGILTDGLVQYRFDLMKNGLSYYVEFILTSSKGLTTSSGLLPFSVAYENPYLYLQLTGENVPDKAGIHLSWQVVQVIGKTSVAPIYSNNDELNVTSGKVFFDEGFNIDNNFTLKLWFRDITSNVNLIYLKGANGVIRVQYQNDSKFHMYKEVNGFVSHYVSQIINGNEFFLCIQQINSSMDLYSEGYYSNVLNSSLNGVVFNQLNGVTFNTLNGKTFN